MTKVELIVAMDASRGIGKDGQLPWHLPADLRHFRQVTTTTQDAQRRNVVVMGRRTWVSIPQKFRPLPDRINVILSRNPDFQTPEGVLVARSFAEIGTVLAKNSLNSETIFIIGGQQIYIAALEADWCHRIHVTQLQQEFDCDTFFPTLPEKFTLVSSSLMQQENDIQYSFLVFETSS